MGGAVCQDFDARLAATIGELQREHAPVFQGRPVVTTTHISFALLRDTLDIRQLKSIYDGNGLLGEVGPRMCTQVSRLPFLLRCQERLDKART